MSKKRKDTSTLFELIAANRNKVKGLESISHAKPEPTPEPPADTPTTPEDAAPAPEPVAEPVEIVIESEQAPEPVETPDVVAVEPESDAAAPAGDVEVPNAPGETAEDAPSEEKPSQDTSKTGKSLTPPPLPDTPEAAPMFDLTTDEETPEADVFGPAAESSAFMDYLTDLKDTWRSLPDAGRTTAILTFGAMVLLAVILFFAGRGSAPKTQSVPEMVARGGHMLEAGKQYLVLADFPYTDANEAAQKARAETYANYAASRDYPGTVEEFTFVDGSRAFIVWSLTLDADTEDANETIRNVIKAQRLAKDYQASQNRDMNFRMPWYQTQPGKTN